MIKQTDHIGSFAKGLQVLEAFGADRPKLSIAQAAAVTGLDRATTRRCLLTLFHEGYADYDGKFFTLTHRTLRLGIGALSALPLPQIVQPWLDELTEQIGQSCSVAIIDETEIVYVARAAQKRVMSIGLMPGSRLPAYCTSMGRVLLASLPEVDAHKYVKATDRQPRTKNTLTDIDDLMTKISQVRESGFALVDQEIEVGLRSIAVPLLNSHNQTVAALNIGMAAISDNVDDVIAAYLPQLIQVQSGLRALL